MTTPDHAQATLYYDGWCDACIKSTNLFTKLDNSRGLIICIDLRSDDPRVQLAGVDPATLASSLHLRTPDGALFAGPEAIRQAFKILGRPRSASWTALPIIRPMFDYCYKVFARNRLRWFANHHCESGSCKLDLPSSHSNPQARNQLQDRQ
jgi:predicted DCC family thiol-disulfide oxidoreductase YuxK